MTQPQLKGQQTIRGIIVPTAWDDNDNVSAVTLAGVDERNYLVENWELFVPLSKALIDATGAVHWTTDAQWRIHINHYDVIDIFKE